MSWMQTLGGDGKEEGYLGAENEGLGLVDWLRDAMGQGTEWTRGSGRRGAGCRERTSREAGRE